MAEELRRYRSDRNAGNIAIESDGPFEDAQGLPDGGLMDEDEELNQQDMDMDVDDEDENERFFEIFEGAAGSSSGGTTFMDEFDKDPHASERIQNLYYPFVSRDEWELASYLLRSDLSVASINIFLSLSLVSLTTIISLTLILCICTLG